MASWQEVRKPGKIEGLKPFVKLTERGADETMAILETALDYAGGNVSEAQRLLRKTNFFISGTTFGDNLFMADSESKIADFGDVMLTMTAINSLDEEMWTQGLVNAVGRILVTQPYNLPFLGTTLKDLGGERAYNLFVTSIARPKGIPMEEAMTSKTVAQLYEIMKGRSFWEMPEAALIPIVMTWYAYSEQIIEENCPSLDELEDGDHDHDLPEFMVESLTSARKKLRSLARVFLGKGLLKSGQRIGNRDGFSLGLKELNGLLD